MYLTTYQIPFNVTLQHACVKGRRSAHATGVSIGYYKGKNFSTIDIESVNSQGSVTSDCRIPLPNDPAILQQVADYLEELAEEIKANDQD